MKFEEMKRNTINHSSSAKLVNQGEDEIFEIVDDSIDEAMVKAMK